MKTIPPIKDTIQEVIRTWEAKKLSAGEGPEQLLRHILTKKERVHTSARDLRNGVLSINVDSASWHYHLALKKEVLLEKLRKRNASAKEIKFYIGEVNGKEKNKAR